jgi:dolichyl-diphosphooligosaccharide--protein glycosyltransferase
MSDDEVVDLGKLWRKFFKKEHTEHAAPEHSSHTPHDPVPQHTSSAHQLFWWAIPTAIIIVIFLFAFMIRVQTVNLPALDGSAENTIHNFYRSQIRDKINSQFPNLPEQNKEALVEQDFGVFIEENEELVQTQIENAAAQYKLHFRDPEGQTYLLGIDPYYYYRQSRNIIEYGTVGTEVRDGEPFDTYKPAPEGSFVEANLHPYVGVLVYRVMGLFSDISLMGAFFYVGALVAALAVIPAFFIGRSIYGNVGGFFSATFLSVNLFFISRTAGESSDTDAWVIFIPLLISWAFLESLSARTLRMRLGLSALAGALIGLYAFAWSGWWFILYFIVATLLIAAVHRIGADSLKNRKFTYDLTYLKDRAYLFLALLVSSGLFVSIFRDFSTFIAVVKRPFQFLDLKAVATTKIWPNVLTTVAELNPASLDQVVNTLGGPFLLFLSIVGITLTLLRKEEGWREPLILFFFGAGIGLSVLAWTGAAQNVLIIAAAVISFVIFGILIYYTSSVYALIEKFEVEYAALFGLWLAATLWSTKSGVRFTLLVVPALAIGIGFFCGALYKLLLRLFSEELHIHKKISAAIVFGLLFLLLIFPNHLAAGYQQGRNNIPSMNDAWYDGLTSITEDSQKDAIITSWWDFGHWFKAIADRPVTFDGGSQNRPQAHWVGKLLLTSDEKTAFGILRMLDCGGNWAFDEVDKQFNDIPRSVKLINQIIVQDRGAAEETLKIEGFNTDESEKILDYTHCIPPEGYVIASEDMVGKAGVWGHFGAWNFDRAAMAFETRDLGQEEALLHLQNKFNLSFEDAQKTYNEIQTADLNQWIAPWPGYISGFNSCRSDNNTILCLMQSSLGEFPLFIDKKTMNATIPSPDGKEARNPRSIVFLEDEKVQERKFQSDIGVSVVLVPNGDSYNALLADPLQGKSMFTQMYFYQGKGLKCFIPFNQQRQISGGFVYVYKVDWECKI